jgi:hypothetical protein
VGSQRLIQGRPPKHSHQTDRCIALESNADARANFRKQTLIERYGADIRLPDLREEIAQCERQGKMHDACMVHYIDLKP